MSARGCRPRPPLRGASQAQAAQVGVEVLRVVEALVPLLEGLAVDGADAAVSLPEQVADQVAADEAAGAGNDNELGRSHALSLKGAHAPVAPSSVVIVLNYWPSAASCRAAE